MFNRGRTDDRDEIGLIFYHIVVENRISGTSRFYGYVSDLHGFTLQLSSARLAENQSSSLTSGLVLESFVKINRE